MGYHRAGFDVVGVDIKPQPRYPFHFVQGDALEYVAAHGHEFDAIHASPPCQRFSTITARWGRSKDHPDLIEPTRHLLIRTRRPYVIENVRGAGLLANLMLCGSMLGLRVIRHRYFETSAGMFIMPPYSCRHDYEPVAVYGHSGGTSKRDGKTFGGVDTWKAAMQIDWMVGDELAEAIPPAYTEYIGRHLLQAVLESRNHAPAD